MAQMNTVQPKALYKSKTVIGASVALGAAAAGMYGHVVDEATQQGVIEVITNTIESKDFLGAIGALFAIYGRHTATTVTAPLTGTQQAMQTPPENV